MEAKSVFWENWNFSYENVAGGVEEESEEMQNSIVYQTVTDKDTEILVELEKKIEKSGKFHWYRAIQFYIQCKLFLSNKFVYSE